MRAKKNHINEQLYLMMKQEEHLSDRDEVGRHAMRI